MDNRLLRPRRRLAVGSATLLTQEGEVLLTEDDEKLMTDDGSLDADALAYIAAVEAADGQALEPAVRLAINDFVVGCKADGIWSAIKASCILAGARTLAGALVPLVGIAPTNVNFVSGDYNRETGLKGDGSTKYLNSNRNSNADPQNSSHQALFIHTVPAVTSVLIGTGFDLQGSTRQALVVSTSNASLRSRTDFELSFSPAVTYPTNNSFFGVSRSSSTLTTARSAGASSTSSGVSQTAYNGNIFVFADNPPFGTTLFSDARLAFYSIGESLDLALLDARVSALITAIGNAIP